MMKKNWVAWLMRSYRITFLLMIMALGLGFFGFDRMGKAEFPEIVVRQGVVAVVYPGATAEEVEVQVAKPLERFLFTYDEVNRTKTTTTSSDGMCVVMVELRDDIHNKDEVWSKIKHGLTSFKSRELPSGALGMVVNDDFGSASALLIAIESESRSYRDLKMYSDDLADALRRIPSVSNVKLYGESREQLSVYVDQQRLSAYGVGKMALAKALNSAGMTTLSGGITGNQQNVPIHVSPTATSEQELENLIIYSDNQNHVVRLRDVAEVRREYDKSDSYIEYNGHPCVLLSLEMVAGNNIVQYGKEVQQVLDDYSGTYLPEDVTISRIADQCKVVENSVWDFMVNLLESMVVVIIVMLVLFPWRTALVAADMVPLTTFISIGVMYLIGIPLNTCTLAGLIIVLGMVVDNAIVVLDGYLEYINRGVSRWHAAAESARKYFMPMMLATLCITVIFFPFLFTLTGNMHDFVLWLPWTILINLMVSLVLAVVLIPVLEAWLIKRRKPQADKPKKRDLTDYVQKTYDKVLDWTFRYPWLTIGGAVVVVVLSLVLIVPNLKVRMMPTAERDQFAVEFFLPAGVGLNETKAIADSLQQVLQQEEDVTSITSFVGCSSPRFHTTYAPKIAGRNYAQFIVNTASTEATTRLIDKYEPLYSERYPNAFVKFKQLDYQNFNTIEYRFYGENTDSLRIVAEALMSEMRKRSDIFNVHVDWEEPRSYINVELDPVASAQMGISRSMAELQLALATGSTKVGQVWEGDYELPVVLKDRSNEHLTCEDVNNLFISSTGVNGVPLRQVGEASPRWAATNIIHRGGERCMTVTCDLKRGVLSQSLIKELNQIMAEKVKIPANVRFEIGGEPENDAKTGSSIALGFGIAVVIVFFFILFNFRNYKITATCLVALLLMMPGALIGLLLMGRAVGLTAIFGFVTLMGMIMRNEILIFEHANDMVAKGYSVRDAAYDAGRRRMVPIFLTTATTAVGVIPMIIAATNFWMPVGVTIFAGGIGSLILVVTVLPVVYWKLRDGKSANRRSVKKYTPQS